MYSQIEKILTTLCDEWSWQAASTRKYVDRLIFTDTYSLRKDMKVSQMAGRVKFKFRYGSQSWSDRASVNTPRFCVSVREKPRDSKGPRLCWIARRDGWMGLQSMIGRKTINYVNIYDMFEDPGNITKVEMDMVNMLYPGILDLLPIFAEGFEKIDEELRKRFNG